MGKYFGTDGFRGEANVGLNVEHAYKIGRFLGWYFGRQKGEKARIVIGRDTRRSGNMFETALASGITASGADAYLMRVTTTPSVAYAVLADGFDCGIMITASHNPYYDNGVKLINNKGEKMEESVIAYVEDYLDGRVTIYGEEADELPFALREKIGSVYGYDAGREAYAEYLISLAGHFFKGKRIGLDCGGGSASHIAQRIFEELGADVLAINDHPDGVNINMDGGSTHIEGLCEYVVKHGLDAGFAYDGDADRCMAVDEKGTVIDGDLILYICGCHMKEKDELDGNTVVTTVMSNFGLYKAFDEAGISYEKTDVGDKYVYECMSEHGYRLGGEQSGHIIFSKNATTGDGILTSIKLMDVMIASGKTLSQLAAPVRIYPQVLKNIRVKDKAKARGDMDVVAVINRVADELGDSGRILVRESGTEPVLRVMVEAESHELCEKYVEQVEAAIATKGHCE